MNWYVSKFILKLRVFFEEILNNLDHLDNLLVAANLNG